ncbi:MAG: hypothetical protein ACR2JD_07430 [Nocardioides sp.]
MTSPAVDLTAAFDRLEDLWTPQVVARLNDYEVKLARLDGEWSC